MLKSAALAFLEATESVRVQIPARVVDDPDHPAYDKATADAFAAHDAALAAKAAAEAAWSQEKIAKRKLSDPEPVEPDWTALDAAIERTKEVLIDHSIFVLLEYRDGEYSAANAWARTDEAKNASLYDLKVRLAGALYVRAEVLDNGEWVDLGLTWDEFRSKRPVTDGVKGMIGEAAWDMCVATGDAAPFKKRGKRSAAT